MPAQRNAPEQIKLDQTTQHNLYQSVIALDKTDHDPVDLLDSVYELLHVSVRDLEGSDGASSTQTRPSAKWALRWLLKRLAAEDETALNLGLEFRTWMLLLHLIKSLPFNVVNQLLKSYDPITIIARILESIQQDDWSKYVEAAQFEDMDINGEQQRLAVDDLIASMSANRKSKKRKRDSTGPNQLSNPSAARCFYYIVQTINFLQQPGGSSEDTNTRTWERRALLEQKPNDTIKILASGFDIFRRILDLTGFVDRSQSVITINIDFCTPLFILRDQACRAGGSAEKLNLETLDQCTLPALRLLHSLESEDPILSGHNRLYQQIRGLIAETCVHTFRAAHVRSEHVDLRRRLQHALQMGTDVSSELLHFILQVAFDCVRRETTAQRTREDPWIRELFDTVSHTPDGHTRLDAAKKLLDTVNDHKLQLSSKGQLNIIELALGLEKAERHAAIDWELVSSAIANNPSRLADQEEHIASITRKVLIRASALRDSSESDAHLYEIVMSGVMLPISQAFASKRDVETFLMLWSQYSEETEALKEGNSPHSIWTDERLLMVMASQLKEGLPDSRRRELLETWSETLEGGDQESMLAIQFVILINCVVAAVDQEEAKHLRQTRLPHRLHNALWKWLDADSKQRGKSEYSTNGHRWRGWRLMSELVDRGLLEIDASKSLEKTEGISHALTFIRKQFKIKNDKAPSWAKLTEAAFAWSYVLQIVLILDPRAESLESKDLLHGCWEKIASLKLTAIPREGEDKARYHVMVANLFHLALNCLALTVEILSLPAWLVELFTPETLAMIRENASYQLEAVEKAVTSLTWMQVWKELGMTSEVHPTLLCRKINDLRVRALAELPAPGESSLEAFSFAVQDASGLQPSTVPRMSRQTIGDILASWIESGLLDEHTIASAVELFNRIIGKSTEDSQYELELAPSDSQKEAAVQGVHDTVQKDSNTKTTELKTTLADANEVLLASESTLDFTTAARMVSIILRAPQLQLIGQRQVDELFTLITLTTLPSRKLDTGSSDAIYLCLCNFFGDVLSYHRHRINGRFHLLLTALSNLLWCLFEPQHAHQHPHWLTSTLSTRCAEQFARLLTSLADPSVSAARAGNKDKSTLNDPTKKARSIAGRHLSQLIISFCSFQLRGRLDPSLRAKINPGLYTIMDAMSQDVRQNISPAMNAPERAIFQALHSEWRRFGRHQA